MKPWKCAASAGLLTVCLFGAGSTLAQEDRLRVTVGLKLWANTWETGTINDDPSTGTNVTVVANDSLKIAPIPSLSVRYGNFVASAGYFVKTNYDFPTSTDMADFPCCAPSLVTQRQSAKREEWDLNFGYFVHPQLAVTVGYKKVDQTYTTTLSAPGVVFTPATSTSKTENTGFTIGVLGSAPLGGGFVLYGNAAVGPMKAKFEGGGAEPKGTYQSSEVGLAWALGDTGATLSLGYKVQIIDLESTGALPQRLRDTTNGAILGVSYTF